MSRSPQNASSTHASQNNYFIRRAHNSENRRAPYRTARQSIHRRPRRNNNVGEISIRFTGTTHIHTGDTAFGMMDAARPQYLRTRGYPSQILPPQPPPCFRYVPSTRVNEFAGVPIPAAGRGSSVAGYHQQTHIGGHTYVPGPNIGPAPFLHTDEAGPEYPRDCRYPQPSGGLYHGGFTSGAQMNAVRPGSVTGVQTPAVGIAPAGSYGVGYSQLSPIATLGFEGQTSQAPFLPGYDTQAAAPPPTLDQQLFPPSWATAANNAEDFLLPAVSANFMHMLDQIF